MGLGLVHYIPLIAYLGFWVAIVASLFGRPIYGLYYMLPFLPYRTMRDHFTDLPLGGNLLTFLVLAVVIGGVLHGKKLPRSKLYMIWLVYGLYLYCSLWLGTALSGAPVPLWLGDINFVTWKDYMLMPLVFVAASLVLDDRKKIRTAILITAITVLAIDRSSLLESLSRSWTSFDENKRDPGPLAFGSNQTAAFFAQFAMFFWGFGQFLQRKKLKLFNYGLVALTLMAAMYCFSRGAYLAIVACVILLGIVKDRKLVVIAAIFLFTWQTVVPTAVTQRINMTHDQNGQLEASAQERVDLWEDAERSFAHSPIFGTGYASFQLGDHVDDLKDTHNWYVKVLVEKGLIGFAMVLFMVQQLYALAIRVFRHGGDSLYRGLGLGLLICLFSSTITNFFGDRWTYIEINGLLWVLVAAAARVDTLVRDEVTTLETGPASLSKRTYAYAG